MNKRDRQLLTRIVLTALIPIAGLVYMLAFMDLGGPKRTSGSEGYARHCAGCHGDRGEGLRSLYPPLDGADYLAAHVRDLPCIIIYGMDKAITVNGKTFDQPMPGINTLSATEVTDIMNFVITSWDNQLPAWSKEDVKAALNRCPQKTTTK